jgi:hypothetical protein
MSAEEVRFVFGPRDRRGLLLGLRLGQLAFLICGGIAVLAIVMGSRASPLALVLVVVVVAIAGLAAFVPLAGRGADEWLPPLAHFVLTGKRTWRSRQPRRGQRLVVSRRGEVCAVEEQPELPPVLRGCILLGVPVARGLLGVVRDARLATWTAVLRVHGSGFALLDNSEKTSRMAAWGAVQSALAHRGGSVAAVQVLVRSMGADLGALAADLCERRDLDLGSPILRSYLALLDESSPVTLAQDIHIALQLSASRSRRQVRQAGGGDAGAGALLSRQLQAFQARLERAGLAVDGALPPRLLAHALREAFDPAALTTLRLAGRRDPEREGVSISNAGPLVARAGWRCYETDSGLHVSYWISEWPRTPVGPDYLVPLLLQTSARVAVSVRMEPVDPVRARRDLEMARTEHLAEMELRARHGFRTSIDRHRQADAVERREAELADGHAEFRFSGHITVTAHSVEELERACGHVEEQARASCLDVRRMDGEHDLGFCATLPICRGVG